MNVADRSAVVDRYADAVPFVSKRHHGGVSPRRLLGEADVHVPVTTTISVYPPGAGADSTVQESGVTYVVLVGRLAFTIDGDVYELDRYDALSVAQGAVRSVVNRSDVDAHLLVLRPRP